MGEMIKTLCVTLAMPGTDRLNLDVVTVGVAVAVAVATVNAAASLHIGGSAYGVEVEFEVEAGVQVESVTAKTDLIVTRRLGITEAKAWMGGTGGKQVEEKATMQGGETCTRQIDILCLLRYPMCETLPLRRHQSC
jgi:hypothetical protein